MIIRIFILLLFTSALNAQSYYYIDPSGADVTNDGSPETPWKTLRYAATQVTTAGDYIMVNPGEYTETLQTVLANGVSIKRATGSIPTIHLRHLGSVAGVELETIGHYGEVAYGNQEIEGIIFEGGLTAYSAIEVFGRCNVHIHNCTFSDFLHEGVVFCGQPYSDFTVQNPYVTDPAYDYQYIPSYYSTGNEFTHNIMSNCSRYTGGYYGGNGNGNLEIGTQDGIKIEYNTIVQTARAYGTNGYCIKFDETTAGNNKNTKINYNTLTAAPFGDNPYGFCIESWFCQGGIEIGNNRITGAIDFANPMRATGTYSAWVHDNIIGPETLGATQERGILFEALCEYVIVERNLIKNVAIGFYIPRANYTGNDYLHNITIKNNILRNIGSTNTALNYQCWGMWMNGYPDQSATINFNLYHNDISAATTGAVTRWGIELPSVEEVHGVRIENNIISNWDGAAIYATEARSQFDTLTIKNNLYYNNGSKILFQAGFNPTRLDTTGNTGGNPLFVSATNFNLQTGSPAIAKGLYISSVLTDYATLDWLTPRSIGAYEYRAGSNLATLTTTNVTNITSTTATSGGNISSDGGAAVTARGVCFHTSANPTIARRKVAGGTGTGTFISNLTSLTEDSVYYVRAYATNSVGTAYGSQRTFTASSGGKGGSASLLKYLDVLVKSGSKLLITQ